MTSHVWHHVYLLLLLSDVFWLCFDFHVLYSPLSPLSPLRDDLHQLCEVCRLWLHDSGRQIHTSWVWILMLSVKSLQCQEGEFNGKVQEIFWIRKAKKVLKKGGKNQSPVLCEISLLKSLVQKQRKIPTTPINQSVVTVVQDTLVDKRQHMSTLWFNINVSVFTSAGQSRTLQRLSLSLDEKNVFF